MTVDGLSNSLRWDDLRELVKEEFGEQITPPPTQLHHHHTPEHHPAPQHTPISYIDDHNNAHARQQYIVSPAIQHHAPSYQGQPPSALKQQEWRVSPSRGAEWHASPQIRAPLLQRQVSYPQQEYHHAVVRSDNYQHDGRENDRGELSNTPRYYAQHHVAPAHQFAETKAKSTGSFFYDQRASGSEPNSRTEELNRAAERFVYRVPQQLPDLPDPHGVNQVRELRNLTMQYHEPSRPQQRTHAVSEPSSPSAASMRPKIYHPSRSYSFSTHEEDQKQDLASRPFSYATPREDHTQSTEQPAPFSTPKTPTRPVVHQVNRLSTLKDRIDQQIREFEVDFLNGQLTPRAKQEEEQELIGQASTDPDCVRDQLLLIGEEEPLTSALQVREEPVMTPREGAISPSSQAVFIPMLQADALDGWAASDSNSSPTRDPTTSSEHTSPFSASSEHYITTIQFRESTEWVAFGDEQRSNAKGHADLGRSADNHTHIPSDIRRSAENNSHIPSPGRYSNATTHIPSQHSNATSSSGQSLFSASSSGVNVRESSEWVPFTDHDDDGATQLPSVHVDEVTPDGTIRSADLLGDVGISVIVEVGSGAGFLRVSDVAPDSSAEASGDVRRGDIVISADGTDLTGTEAVLRGFTKAVQGPVGTLVSLCLMDPNEMRPRNLRLRRTPKSVTPVQKFEDRQRQLVASLQALNSDPHTPDALAGAIMSLRTPGVREVPRVLVIGSRGHGKCSLITSLLSLLAGARTRPASLEMCSLRRGEALLGVNVERVLEGVGRDRQPMEITVSCALDELDTEREAEAVLTALMSGKYGIRETVEERRERVQSGEDTTVTTGPAHVVVLVQDCRVTPRPSTLEMLRRVTRENRNLPVVVAISKMEDAALYCTDVEGMVAKMAKVLSKSSFFPVALGSEGNRGEGMCRDASRMAVLQLFERVRALGTHHALHGHREATWQQSCDFYM